MMHMLPDCRFKKVHLCLVPLLETLCHPGSKRTAGAKQRELYNTKRGVTVQKATCIEPPPTTDYSALPMAMSMITLTIKGYHQTPRLLRSLLHQAVCPWLSTQSEKCPCAAAKLSTDAQEEGVSWMNQLWLWLKSTGKGMKEKGVSFTRNRSNEFNYKKI